MKPNQKNLILCSSQAFTVLRWLILLALTFNFSDVALAADSVRSPELLPSRSKTSSVSHQATAAGEGPPSSVSIPSHEAVMNTSNAAAASIAVATLRDAAPGVIGVHWLPKQPDQPDAYRLRIVGAFSNAESLKQTVAAALKRTCEEGLVQGIGWLEPSRIPFDLPVVTTNTGWIAALVSLGVIGLVLWLGFRVVCWCGRLLRRIVWRRPPASETNTVVEPNA